MEAANLKKEFGKDIVFWGGIDSQRILPTGTPSDVEAEVRHVMRELGHGGGFILCAVHNIQADVTPENVLAMYEAARKWGTYPISRNV
jgi:uroporphyrinogen decarboxylase